MADLIFPDMGNALAAGAHARYYGLQSDALEGAEKRRKAVQPDVQAAMGGDNAAMARVAAGDPTTAAALTGVLGRLDANQRAQTKEQAEYTTNSANAILQADPADRAGVYQQMYAEGQRRGYKMTLPSAYSPQLDGVLRSHRAMGQNVNDWFKSQEGVPQPMGGAAAGGGGQFGGAIAGIESNGQPNGGYGAVGPVANAQGNRAYGKYQVLDSNIGPWTQEILGKAMTPQEFLANQQAQDAVFNAKFGQYAQKYGPAGASRAWFAGEGGMNNPNATDVNGMSVARYESKFNNALGGNPAGGATGGFAPPDVARATAAPGQPGPVAMPPPPSGVVPPGQPPAQMPGPPQGLVPPGPAPAQMPGTPPIAQGSGGDGSGNPQQPAAQAPSWQAEFNDVRRHVPPGWAILGTAKSGMAYDGAGRLRIRNRVTGEETAIEVPKAPTPTFGWQQNGGSLSPVPGGPNDPETMKREAQARQMPPQGYQPSASGEGLAFIPGGPSDPQTIERNADVKRRADEKAIPPAIQKALQENVASLKQLDRVGELLTRTPDSVGGAGSVAASMLPGGEWLQNRLDKDGVQLRALISDIAGMTIHDRSGAAVSVSEFKRLRPYIPSIADDKATIERKLANFRAVYEEAVRDTAGYYGPDNGFKAYTPATDYLSGGNRGQVIAPPTAPPTAAPPTSLKMPSKDGGGRPPLESFQR